MKALEILPAIDVKDGVAIRLTKGELDNQSKYGDPLEVAGEFVKSGVKWIHLVDLDAAFGLGNNFEILDSIIKSVDIKIQLSGGIKDDESLNRALTTNCSRINLGTAALDNPEWVESVIKKHGDKIAVALDVDGKVLSPRGGTKSGGDLFQMITRLDKSGCARYVLTDVNRDGALSGPNLELLKEVTSFTKTPIVASGGVSSLSDVKALMQLTDQGVEAVIIGKGLYTGTFTLAQVLSTVKGE
jgi:1-(5-phosphoribosyl)-5-[(5-phosphoribosylamino)methylideneamino] imidazole-4-carboxamide isomerase/N-(5'phosphoribosyl)anthranilate isomerase